MIGQRPAPVEGSGGPEPFQSALARTIWETSRRDEGTISATGANIIAAALGPLIEARVREARFSAVPGPLYNRVMGLLLSHPLPDALYAAEDLKNAIGASAQRRATREARRG